MLIFGTLFSWDLYCFFTNRLLVLSVVVPVSLVTFTLALLTSGLIVASSDSVRGLPPRLCGRVGVALPDLGELWGGVLVLVSGLGGVWSSGRVV